MQLQIVKALVLEMPVIAVQVGWGGGKTSGLIFAAKFISQTRPGTAVLLVTDSNERFKGVLQPLLREWLGADGWEYHTGDRTWRGPHTGSSIIARSYYRPGTRSATHNPLEGLNITSGVVIIDEAQTMQPEVAKKAAGRLRSKDYPPTRIIAGLPVPDAWWVALTANRDDCAPIFDTSYANAENLHPEWFEEIKQDPEEYEAMIMNRPRPPSGVIYGDWRPVAHPKGNLAPDDWTYSPEMTGRVCIDFGYKKPACLIIVHDDELGCDIIAAEFHPKNAELHELAALILGKCWPRRFKDSMPRDGRVRLMLDMGSGDVSGKQRHNRTVKNDIKDMALPPGMGGIGLMLRTTRDPAKVDVDNGIQRTRRRINLRGDRSLLCAQDVWAVGASDLRHKGESGNSVRKAIETYRRHDGGGRPIKDGREDPLDALRYDTTNYCWFDGAMDGRTAVAVPKPVPTRAAQVVRGRKAGRQR